MVDFFAYAKQRNLRVTTRDSSGRVVRRESGRSAYNREKRRQAIAKKQQEEFQRKRKIELSLKKGAVNVLKFQAEKQGLDPNDIELKSIKVQTERGSVTRQIPVISSRRQFMSKNKQIEQQGYYSINPRTKKLEFKTTFQLEADVKKLTRKVRREAPARVTAAKIISAAEKDIKIKSAETKLERLARQLDESNVMSKQEYQKLVARSKAKVTFTKLGKKIIAGALISTQDIINLARAAPKLFNLIVSTGEKIGDLSKTAQGRALIRNEISKALKKTKQFQKLGLVTKDFIKKNLSDEQVKTIAKTLATEFKKDPINVIGKTAGSLILFSAVTKTASLGLKGIGLVLKSVFKSTKKLNKLTPTLLKLSKNSKKALSKNLKPFKVYLTKNKTKGFAQGALASANFLAALARIFV